MNITAQAKLYAASGFVLLGIVLAALSLATVEKRPTEQDLRDQQIATAHAQEHLGYLDEAVAELYKIYYDRRPIAEAHSVMEEMLEHDQHVVDAMLAAEAAGVNLRKAGLVDLFCDNLEEQYKISLLINGGKLVPELAPEDLTSRVARGVPFEEAAQGVISALVTDAMEW